LDIHSCNLYSNSHCDIVLFWAYHGFWFLQQNDWELITPHFWNLPNDQNISKRLCLMLDQIPLTDWYSISICISLTLCILLPAILIANDPSLSSPFGWTLTSMMFIFLTSTYPIAKYANCLALEKDSYASLVHIQYWFKFFLLAYFLNFLGHLLCSFLRPRAWRLADRRLEQSFLLATVYFSSKRTSTSICYAKIQRR